MEELPHTKSIIPTVGIAIGGILVLGIIGWIIALASTSPAENVLLRTMPFPIACTSRGCVTSAQWNTQHTLDTRFAGITGSDLPSIEQSLTTAIRRHLVANAFLQSPVRLADARRYREEILRTKNEQQVQDALGIPLSEYDKAVILPLLQQEALKQQNSVESTAELYQTLTNDRPVFLLLFHYRWDDTQGAAVKK